MKKGILTKIGATAVVLSLVTMSLVGGTFAKYVSTASATGTAQVAKWAVSFEKGGTKIGEDFSFNLEDISGNKELASDNIAPGSYGEIVLEITGAGSEVGYTYSAEADITDIKGIPLTFYSTESDMTNGTDPLVVKESKITIADSNKVNLADVGTTQTVNVFWKWADDATDTTIGETVESGNIKITLTAEQLVDVSVTP